MDSPLKLNHNLNFLYSILLVALVTGSVEQSSGLALNKPLHNTPESVVQVLDSLYPGPKEVQWTKKRKRYTADFIYQGLNHSITFDKNGNLIKHVEEISFAILPARIQEKINLIYKSFKIIMVLQRTDHNKLEYEIEVIQGKQHYILNYHAKGYLIHQYEVYRYDPAMEITN